MYVILRLHPRLPRACTLALAVPLVACSAENTGDRVVVRDSAGVAIVYSRAPGWAAGAGWEVSASPLVDIGGVEGGGGSANELFRVTGVVRLSDGRIVIANSGTHQLRFYGPRGGYLRSVGREGSGPGEFRRLAGVWALENDTLLTYDSGNDRLAVFTGAGRFVRSFRLEPVTDPFLFPEDVLADGTLLAAHASPMTALEHTGINVDSALLLRFDGAGAFIDSLGRLPHNERFVWRNGNRQTVLGAPFARNASFAVTAEAFCYGTGAEYRIRCYAPDGTLRQVIRMEYAPVPVTPEVIDAYIELRTAEAPDAWRRSFLRLLSEIPFPESIPAYRDLLTDTEGNLWVEEYGLPGDEVARWRVFDPAGRLLGRVDMPPGFEALQIGLDYVLGRWRDQRDVEHIRVYRLRKSAA